MKMLLSGLVIAGALLGAAPTQAFFWNWDRPESRTDVNFAFGAATTNEASSLDSFALQDPQIAGLLAAIQATGLDAIGMEQQVQWAIATLNDVDPDSDLFWVYGGANNYVAGSEDPTLSPAEIGGILARLYDDLGARTFVVPNLPPLGILPFSAPFPQEVRDGLNALTGAHNQILAGVLAQFAADRPDATLIPVDVFSTFLGHLQSGEFSNVTDACTALIDPKDAAVPGICDGFLFIDDVHPASPARVPVAQDVADSLSAAGFEADRVISIGDSLSDTGALMDTWLRAVGFPFPAPPFTAGRFTEGPNVVDQLEELLDTPVRSQPFAQPYSVGFEAARDGWQRARGTLELEATVFIPKHIDGESQRFGSVWLSFGSTSCRYRASDAGGFDVQFCTRGARAGDRVDVTEIDVRGNRRVERVSLDLLYYNLPVAD